MSRLHRIVITGLVAGAALMATSAAEAQSARQVRGAAPVVPLANEPPSKIIIVPPLAEPLSHGRVVIQYRSENLHIVPWMCPIRGETATAAGPNIAPWRWADASGEPLIVNGLPAGPHKILIQRENAKPSTA